jgi:hypothetical protein
MDYQLESSGLFTLKLEQGEYEAVAIIPGFGIATKNFTVTANQPLDISIETEAIEEAFQTNLIVTGLKSGVFDGSDGLQYEFLDQSETNLSIDEVDSITLRPVGRGNEFNSAEVTSLGDSVDITGFFSLTDGKITLGNNKADLVQKLESLPKGSYIFEITAFNEFYGLTLTDGHNLEFGEFSFAGTILPPTGLSNVDISNIEITVDVLGTDTKLSATTNTLGEFTLDSKIPIGNILVTGEVEFEGLVYRIVESFFCKLKHRYTIKAIIPR